MEFGFADRSVEGDLPVEVGSLWDGQGECLDGFGFTFEVAWKFESDLNFIDAWGWDDFDLVQSLRASPALMR